MFCAAPPPPYGDVKTELTHVAIADAVAPDVLGLEYPVNEFVKLIREPETDVTVCTPSNAVPRPLSVTCAPTGKLPPDARSTNPDPPLVQACVRP